MISSTHFKSNVCFCFKEGREMDGACLYNRAFYIHIKASVGVFYVLKTKNI